MEVEFLVLSDHAVRLQKKVGALIRINKARNVLRKAVRPAFVFILRLRLCADEVDFVQGLFPLRGGIKEVLPFDVEEPSLPIVDKRPLLHHPALYLEQRVRDVCFPRLLRPKNCEDNAGPGSPFLPQAMEGVHDLLLPCPEVSDRNGRDVASNNVELGKFETRKRRREAAKRYISRNVDSFQRKRNDVLGQAREAILAEINGPKGPQFQKFVWKSGEAVSGEG